MPAPARKVALTDKFLKALKPAPAGKRVTIWDAMMPNLAVRITDKGSVSFVAERLRLEAEAAQQQKTFAAVAEDFVRLHLPRLRTARASEALIRRELIPVL